LAQLNFQVPDELLARLDAQRPRYLDRKSFVCLLLDESLDKAGTLTERATATPPKGGGAIESGVSKAVSSIEEELNQQPLEKKAKTKKAKDVFSTRVISPDLIPADLLDCQQLLPEWWTVKKGVRSEGVWNRVCGKLRGWTPEQRRDALERAIASGWGDVFEPKPIAATQGKKAIDWSAVDNHSFFK
jgi:hypothetical protein